MGNGFKGIWTQKSPGYHLKFIRLWPSWLTSTRCAPSRGQRTLAAWAWAKTLVVERRTVCQGSIQHLLTCSWFRFVNCSLIWETWFLSHDACLHSSQHQRYVGLKLDLIHQDFCWAEEGFSVMLPFYSDLTSRYDVWSRIHKYQYQNKYYKTKPITNTKTKKYQIPKILEKISIPTSCRLDDKFRLTGKLIAREGDLARGVWHYAQVKENSFTGKYFCICKLGVFNHTYYCAGLVWSLQRWLQLLEQPESAAGWPPAAPGEGLQGQPHHLLQLHHLLLLQHLEQPHLPGHTFSPNKNFGFKKGEKILKMKCKHEFRARTLNVQGSKQIQLSPKKARVGGAAVQRRSELHHSFTPWKIDCKHPFLLRISNLKVKAAFSQWSGPRRVKFN